MVCLHHKAVPWLITVSSKEQKKSDARKPKGRVWMGRAASQNPAATGLLPILGCATWGFSPRCSGLLFACLPNQTLGVHIWQRRNSSKGEGSWKCRGGVVCPHPTWRQGWQTKRKQTPTLSAQLPLLPTPSPLLGVTLGGSLWTFPARSRVAHKLHDFRDSVVLAKPQRETW